MSEQPVVEERSGAIARLWLNRPERHNAFDDSMIAALLQVLRRLGADPAVRVLVLGGRGKSFCAGASLDWMRRMAGYGKEENLRDAAQLAEMLHTLNTLPQPTIARVQGAALAGGTGLVAACDIAVAAANAVFGTTEVRLGLIPATISPYVIAAIGPRAARRYFLTGEKFSAPRARELGLVHELCAAEALDHSIESLAAALLAGGPSSQAACKRLASDVAGRPLDTALIEDTSRRFATARCGGEARAGIAAFFAKRPPPWSSP